jgi:undecaprenyl-diphosphatase
MSIPAVLGAALLELKDAGGTTVDGSTVIAYIVGMVVSAVVGYFAIRIMINVVRRKRYLYFSIYCLVIGLVAIIGHFLTK